MACGGPCNGKTTDNAEYKEVLKIIAVTLRENPRHWTSVSHAFPVSFFILRIGHVAQRIVGFSEETVTGDHRLIERSQRHFVVSSHQCINDSETKSRFDNLFRCRHSTPDGIMCRSWFAFVDLGTSGRDAQTPCVFRKLV